MTIDGTEPTANLSGLPNTECLSDPNPGIAHTLEADLDPAAASDPQARYSSASLESAVLANSPDLVLVVDELAMPTYANTAAETFLGLWRDELLGRTLLDFIHPDDQATTARAILSNVAEGASPSNPVCVRVRRVDQTWRDIELLVTDLASNPAVGGTLINARDVSDRDNFATGNSVARESFREVFRRSPIGMAITTLEGQYVRVNDAMCDLLGRTADDLMGSSVLATTHDDDLRLTVDAAVSLLDGATGSFSIEKRFLRSNGEPVWTRATTTLLRDDDDKPVQFLTQVEDIEDRHQLMEQLRISALRDPLTGLSNRSGLQEYLAGLDSDAQIGVVAVDLDRFKVVNDSEGHAAGDEVLRTVASRIASSVRSCDHASRTGGDEFVVVFTEFDSYESFAGMARRLIRQAQEPIRVENCVLTIGASAGVAIGPARDAAALMVQADRASYQAKRGGMDVAESAYRG